MHQVELRVSNFSEIINDVIIQVIFFKWQRGRSSTFKRKIEPLRERERFFSLILQHFCTYLQKSIDFSQQIIANVLTSYNVLATIKYSYFTWIHFIYLFCFLALFWYSPIYIDIFYTLFMFMVFLHLFNVWGIFQTKINI